MGMKRGYIVGEDTAGARHARIRRFRLSNGEHVYVPRDVATVLLTQHSPAEEFFFVEKGLLGRTAWAGTLGELRRELAGGALSPKDLMGFALPVQQTHAGWVPMPVEDDHAFVGAKRGALAETMRQSGRPDTAAAMTAEAWIRVASSEGACVAERADNNHGMVVCDDDRGHAGDHTPVCPECDVVKQILFAVADSAGAWGR